MFHLNDAILVGVVFSAMLVGVLLPGPAAVFQPFTVYLLMVLLFLSFISTELKDIGKMIRSRALLVAWLSFLKLIALPVAIYSLLKINPRLLLLAIYPNENSNASIFTPDSSILQSDVVCRSPRKQFSPSPSMAPLTPSR